MRKGVPVSPGVAVARACRVDEVLARRDPHYLDAAALSDEVRRFDQACAAAAQELDASSPASACRRPKIVVRLSPAHISTREASAATAPTVLLRTRSAVAGRGGTTHARSISAAHRAARAARHEASRRHQDRVAAEFGERTAVAGSRRRAPRT